MNFGSKTSKRMASYNYWFSGAQPSGSHNQPYPFPATTSAVLQPIQPSVLMSQAKQDSAESSVVNLDLKILNPANKKEYRMYFLWHVSPDHDSPSKLKNEIISQYGQTAQLT